MSAVLASTFHVLSSGDSVTIFLRLLPFVEMEMLNRPATLAPAATLRRIGDRQLAAALLLAGVVLVTRSVLIQLAHSETVDSEYHLNRGLAFLTGTIGTRILNDPPLGEALSAIPMWITQCLPTETARGLYGYWLRPETILILIAVWKSLLFLPLIGVVFGWCRTLYGLGSAWLVTALFLVDPTFAAHVGLPTVDVLGGQGVVIASVLAWRYFQKPSVRTLNVACLAVAVAVLLKHTAALLPVIVLAYAGLWWYLKPWLERRRGQDVGDRETERATWLERVRAVGHAVVIIPLLIWALTLFDFSPPINYVYDRPHIKSDSALLRASLPAGVYIGSFVEGMRHNTDGHDNYLFGQRYDHALWYYFPVVASYKVPLGILAVVLLGLASIRAVRPRWDEWAILIPLLAYTVWLMTARINIGFRHFMPAYAFLLILSARCVATGTGKWWRITAWTGVAAAALHGLSFHPDYLSYINLPRRQVYLDISDSNVDWGQSLKQVRAWVERFKEKDDRWIYIRYFGNDRESVNYYLRGLIPNKVRVLKPHSPLPGRGILIVSPVWVAGVYDRQDRYAALRRIEPTDTIGHSMLVYDLDRLNQGRRFRWRPPRKGPIARQVYQE